MDAESSSASSSVTIQLSCSAADSLAALGSLLLDLLDPWRDSWAGG